MSAGNGIFRKIDRRDTVLMLLSLLLACCVWLVHELSADYTVYMQYRLKVKTGLQGFAEESIANETVMVRCTASGFYILKNGGVGGEIQLPVTVDRKFFTLMDDTDDNFCVFSLNTSEIRKYIDSQLEENVRIDFIEDDVITFDFESKGFKKVPVIPISSISMKSQYMMISAIELSPDSVLVYGSGSEMEAVTEVRTVPIILDGLDKSVHSIIDIERIPGLRIDPDNIYYKIDVDRYVETTVTLPVEVRNVPSGKTVVIVPSSVTLSVRRSFHSDMLKPGDISVFVDFRDYERSRGTNLVPIVDSGENIIYSCSIDPQMVSCIVTETK